MKKILIITSSNDFTADYMIEKFKDKANFYRFNTDKFSDYEISICNLHNWIIKNKYWKVKENDIDSIYFRKPVFPNLDEYDIKYHDIIRKEILTTIQGILETFKGRCLSRPSVLRKAENKIFQLNLSQDVGFTIPESLITNSNNFAKKFCINKTRIVKPLSTGKINYKNKVGIIQTNVVNKKIDIIGLECWPVYFQQYVKKDYELRVTVVNNNFYPVRIDTTEKIDWRKRNSKNKYSLVELPLEIKKKCIEMLDLLSLKFGAFDFIVSKGEYVFLEVNPNGQWYWLEYELNLNISDSIYNYLVGEC